MQGYYPYYGASGIIDYINDYLFDDDLILVGEDGENVVSRNLPLAFRVQGKNLGEQPRPCFETKKRALTLAF